MKKNFLLALALLVMPAAVIATNFGCTGNANEKTQQEQTSEPEVQKSKVYFSKNISSESLMRIYSALGRKAEGKNVAVKISTGEPGGHNFLDPALIAPLVKEVKGTIVECNTAYGGRRSKTADHLKAAEEHGFSGIAAVDIMDVDGDVALPVGEGWTHIEYDYVGKHFLDYDFTVVLSHFKGHAMGGFGGAIKNISIGIASSGGKAWIHTAGKTQDVKIMWGQLPQQDDFLESMAEAAKAVIGHCGENIIYINIANNLSVDCDCDAHPHAPQMKDIGILASLDPVALDKACVDLVYASDDDGKKHLIERMESRHGIHTLEHAEQLGIGTQDYELIDIDK